MIGEEFLRQMRIKKVMKEILSSSIVCDFGCGKKAVFLNKVKNFIKEGFGFDIELENCEKNNIKLSPINLETDRVLLRDNAIDCVTILAVLEHLNNPKHILCESFRILKSGGKLIITTPSPMSKRILEFLAFKARLIDAKEIEDHKNYFSKKDLKDLIVSAGFKMKNIKEGSFEFGMNNFFVVKK